MADIDVGSEATDRSGSLTYGYTVVDTANPANASGKLTSIKIFAATNLSNVKVGTLYGTPTTFTSRDSHTIGSVTAGSLQTFSGLDIAVEAGDFIGIYFSAGSIERDTSGGAGSVYYKTGDQFGAGAQSYSALASNAISVYGTGETISITYKTVSGAVATTSLLICGVSKHLALESVGTTGAVNRTTSYLKALAVGTVATVGALAKAAGKALSGSVATVASVRPFNVTKAISAAVAASGAVSRAVGKVVAAATVSTTATVSRAAIWLKAVALATVDTTANLTRKAGKIITGTVGATASVRPFNVWRSLTATVGTSAGVARAMTKHLAAAAVGTTASAIMTTAKHIAATVVGTTASVTRIAAHVKAIDVAIVSTTAGLVCGVKKILAGSAATVASVRPFSVVKAVGATTVGTTGKVIRFTTKAVAAAVVSTIGTIISKPTQILLGGVTAVARIAHKAVYKILDTTVPTVASITPYIYDIVELMNRTMRRIHAKVQITYTDPFFSAGVATTADAIGRYTYTEQTVDNVTETAYPWFSLHRNNLTGYYHPGPGNRAYSVGWWGTQLSAAVTGAFVPTYPLLTITHAPRSVASLLVVGDDKLLEYPVDFTIRMYDENDILLHTEPVTSNTLVEWTGTVVPMVTTVAKQTLEITKWSRPEAVCKITQFFTTLEEVYLSEDGDIVSLSVQEQREYTGMTIPQGNLAAAEIRVKLNNIEGIFDAGNRFSRLYGMLLNNRAIKAWLGVDLIPSGVRRWYPLGTFYSRDWNAPDDQVWAEVSGQDSLARLQTTTFSTSEVYEDQSLQDLAIIVMADAGLSSEDWEIDPALDAITVPYAWFDPTSHRDCLRKIAAAALGQCYCNRDGKIVLEVYDPATVLIDRYAYTTGNVFDFDHPLKWSEMVNRVEAQARPRVPGAEEEILIDSESFTVPAGDTVTKTHFFVLSPCIDIQAPAITADPDISVDSYTAYAWGISITYKNDGVIDGDVTEVTVDGKILDVVGRRVAVAEDAASIARNGLQTLPEPISSEFWQDEDRAQTVADALLASYKNPRKDIVMTGRGNIAQLLGDRVTCPDSRTAGSTAEFGIVGQDIDYDGGLRVRVAAQRLIMELSKSVGTTVGTTASIVAIPVEMKELAAATVDTAATIARKTGKRLKASVGTLASILTGEYTFQLDSHGAIRNSGSSYAAVWGAAVGDDILTVCYAFQLYFNPGTPTNEIARYAMIFATGDIIAAGKTITSAELWFYPTHVGDTGSPWDLVIQSGQPTYPHDPIVIADWDESHYAGDGGSIASSAMTPYSWHKIDLNATGLGWIQMGAGNKTKLVMRTSREIAGTPPGGSWEYEGILGNYPNHPYLVVHWEA